MHIHVDTHLDTYTYIHIDLPGSNSNSSNTHRSLVTPRTANRKSLKGTSGHAGQHATCLDVRVWLTVSQ